MRLVNKSHSFCLSGLLQLASLQCTRYLKKKLIKRKPLISLKKGVLHQNIMSVKDKGLILPFKFSASTFWKIVKSMLKLRWHYVFCFSMRLAAIGIIALELRTTCTAQCQSDVNIFLYLKQDIPRHCGHKPNGLLTIPTNGNWKTILKIITVFFYHDITVDNETVTMNGIIVTSCHQSEGDGLTVTYIRSNILYL